MAYTANKYRKENTKPVPKFEIDGVYITSAKYMHEDWFYMINNTWECETNVPTLLVELE